MKICYIGHEYHRKTASTDFMAEFLEANSSEFKRYDSLPDIKSVGEFDCDALVAEKFDLICVFQLELLAQKLADMRLASRLIFIPMYDGCMRLGNEFWAKFSNRDDICLINFSDTLHTKLAKLQINSYRFKFFPQPGELANKANQKQRVFFWQRTDRPSWHTVKTLFSGQHDMQFHLHLAGDPSLSAAIDVDAEKLRHDISISTWFSDPSEYRSIVAKSDIFVAPREYEGIGMSFLEAMAAGKCVVAPNTPTMNEYITHGVNGLLYDINAPTPLDFTNAAEMGRAAHQTVVNGYRLWQWDFEHRMRDILFSMELPSPIIYQEVGSYVQGPGAVDFPKNRISEGDLARISVAVVCYNCEADVGPTLESIIGQTYPEMEIVVVDGQSTDGTIEKIERYRSQIDIFVSEPDAGVYDAMNKAARLASGDYIIFINAGDQFYLPTSLEEAISNVFAENGLWREKARLPDFIVGHHVYLYESGASGLHKAADFDETWAQLQTGTMTPQWWGGIPCHQSTLTRRALLAEEKYDLDFKIAADHNFMFTMRGKGKIFVHSNSLLSTYVSGGMSYQQTERCFRESFTIASRSSPAKKEVESYYEKMFGIMATIEDAETYWKEAEELHESGLFYDDWYRARYINSSSGIKDPALHFLIRGRKEGCWPNPFFDPSHYLMRNTDVFEAGMDPFFHYLRYGRKRHRPTYDWDCQNRAMSPFRSLFRWNDHDLEGFEKILASCEPERLLSVLRSRG